MHQKVYKKGTFGSEIIHSRDQQVSTNFFKDQESSAYFHQQPNYSKDKQLLRDQHDIKADQQQFPWH